MCVCVCVCEYGRLCTRSYIVGGDRAHEPRVLGGVVELGGGGPVRDHRHVVDSGHERGGHGGRAAGGADHEVGARGFVVVRAEEGLGGRVARGPAVDDVDLQLLVAGLDGLHGELRHDVPAARVELLDGEEAARGDGLPVGG